MYKDNTLDKEYKLNIFVHRNFKRKSHSDCDYHIVPRPRKWGLTRTRQLFDNVLMTLTEKGFDKKKYTLVFYIQKKYPFDLLFCLSLVPYQWFKRVFDIKKWKLIYVLCKANSKSSYIRESLVILYCILCKQ